MDGWGMKTECDLSGTTWRILLIKSNYNAPVHLSVVPPLGLMCLAAYLREHYRYQVKIEDLRLSGNNAEFLETAIRDYAPDVVGISALSFETDAIAWIAERVKHVNKNTTVLLGGPHSTSYPEMSARIPGIDYVVVGEGEIATGRLIERLFQGGDVSGLTGLAYLRGDQVITTGRAEYIEELDSLPMPAYDLIPLDRTGIYTRITRTGAGKFMTLFTSRGCPYQCVYCHNVFGKKFRFRSAKSLIHEIRYLYDTYGIRDYEIVDDIFNLDRERLVEFCDRVTQSGMKLNLVFPIGMRGDILDEFQLSKLKHAGTIFLAFAIETGSLRMQKLLKKNIQLDKIKQNIEIAHKLRIHPHGFFMIGLPDETLEDMKMTVKFMLSSKLHTCLLFVTMPFEGTELGRMAREMGPGPVSDFSMSYHTKNFINLTRVSTRIVNLIRYCAIMLFYLNPIRLFFFFRDFPRKRELPTIIMLFFQRLRWRTS